MSQLLILALVVALVVFARLWLKQSGPTRLKWALYITIAAVAALALTGRLHWLTAVGAAIVGTAAAIIKQLYPLLRFFPLLGAFISRAGYGKGGNARFRTAWLRLEINPALGTLDGEVLQGEFKGRRLSSMNSAELETLHETLRGQDKKSAMLLKSYIALRNRSRGARGARGGDGAAQTVGEMTREEALDILGLKTGAASEDIIRAHKRLMQKMHPDRGGSSYLAAKINQAKEVLLEK